MNTKRSSLERNVYHIQAFNPTVQEIYNNIGARVFTSVVEDIDDVYSIQTNIINNFRGISLKILELLDRQESEITGLFFVIVIVVFSLGL